MKEKQSLLHWILFEDGKTLLKQACKSHYQRKQLHRSSTTHQMECFHYEVEINQMTRSEMLMDLTDYAQLWNTICNQTVIDLEKLHGAANNELQNWLYWCYDAQTHSELLKKVVDILHTAEISTECFTRKEEPVLVPEVDDMDVYKNMDH